MREELTRKFPRWHSVDCVEAIKVAACYIYHDGSGSLMVGDGFPEIPMSAEFVAREKPALLEFPVYLVRDGSGHESLRPASDFEDRYWRVFDHENYICPVIGKSRRGD